jgi:hypothetical protein
MIRSDLTSKWCLLACAAGLLLWPADSRDHVPHARAAEVTCIATADDRSDIARIDEARHLACDFPCGAACDCAAGRHGCLPATPLTVPAAHVQTVTRPVGWWRRGPVRRGIRAAALFISRPWRR